MQTSPEKRVQLFDEVAPLKELMVWGEPGCEALLGQLLPKSKSLFFSYYEVPKARQEFRRMQSLIEGEGTAVIRVKDAFAGLLERRQSSGLPPSLKNLELRLVQRADEFFEIHRQEKEREIANEGLEISVEDIYLEVKSDIRRILHEDAEAYGEPAAIRLNHALSLSRHLPVSNIFYGRDQSSALGSRILLSSMRWDIRKPEVGIYREALIELGYGNVLIQAEEGTIEGGDLIVFGDTCYIGVGARTTLGAVRDIYRRVGSMLEDQGIQFVAVVNEKHERDASVFASPTDEHMHIMHLDMFWIPLGKDLVMAYGEELDHRKALRITRRDGRTISEDLGSFRDHLAGRGIEIMDVTAQEQQDYATNLLNLGNNKVIVSLSRNERVIAELQRRGYRVLQAQLDKLVGGYGAIHCLTAPVRRDASLP
jgi:arginine deiminase